MSTVLITGANRGIGLALATQFAARGDSVIAVCRKSSDALDKLGVRVEAGVEVTDAAALADLVRRLEGTELDVLVNNAGVLRRDAFETLEDALDDCRLQFEVNALAPLRVTRALLDRLAASSKVAIVTSRMGSIADNDSGGYWGYRMSKAAVNIGGVSLAHELKARGIAVALLHPGYVRTDMTGHTGDVETSESAAGLIARIDALSLETSGGFWHANGEKLEW
ncbi:MAG: short-chain dehydrogenase [Gammaproteobacteria bacterium HGW-Gammaproteobacteria-8]|nr:MAG: short-chain dehydrogenase [Gammaproteobacteria bacterium HGW-Gammaproteobacteria-8]